LDGCMRASQPTARLGPKDARDHAGISPICTAAAQAQEPGTGVCVLNAEYRLELRHSAPAEPTRHLERHVAFHCIRKTLEPALLGHSVPVRIPRTVRTASLLQTCKICFLIYVSGCILAQQGVIRHLEEKCCWKRKGCRHSLYALPSRGERHSDHEQLR